VRCQRHVWGREESKDAFRDIAAFQAAFGCDNRSPARWAGLRNEGLSGPQVVLPTLPGGSRDPRNFRPFEIRTDVHCMTGLEVVRLASFANCIVKKQLKL
jgi:hypothetical protein